MKHLYKRLQRCPDELPHSASVCARVSVRECASVRGQLLCQLITYLTSYKSLCALYASAEGQGAPAASSVSPSADAYKFVCAC